MSKDKPTILFLCTGNSCRSQMAEGLARALKGEEVEVYSAGVAPEGLNSNAVAVMEEIGIDISEHRSKHVSELAEIEFDYTVTLCDASNAMSRGFPGAQRTVHVGFDDPTKISLNAKSRDESLLHFRRVRDEIKAFIERLPEELHEVLRDEG